MRINPRDQALLPRLLHRVDVVPPQTRPPTTVASECEFGIDGRSQISGIFGARPSLASGWWSALQPTSTTFLWSCPGDLTGEAVPSLVVELEAVGVHVQPHGRAMIFALVEHPGV